MRTFRWALLVCLLNLIASPGFSASGAPTAGREVTVAAAADLNSALTEIAASFRKQTGITVKLSFGSSGALAQQIQNGAPFDLFFSADMDYPRQLADAGQAEASSLYRYAVGGLALWVPADSPLDVEHKGMNVLSDPAIKKIAIALFEPNPPNRPAQRKIRCDCWSRSLSWLQFGSQLRG
jgi:molybdate transport system substrate-binding protein